MARRFDIHIQTLPEADQRATFKFMSFGFDGAIGVKGFQALINQWLKCLLTQKGSDPADLVYGTNFTALIGSNVPLADARDVAVLAVNECNDQVQRFNRASISLTLSERLANAQVVNFVEKPSDPGFEITVEIKNQANERLLLNLPVLSAV
jgi:hypothetical protein